VATKKNQIRKKKADWLEAALDVFEKEGIEGVRVERLARGLNVAKSGFYWHFKDRDDLHEQMLRYWEDEFTGVVTLNVELVRQEALLCPYHFSGARFHGRRAGDEDLSLGRLPLLGANYLPGVVEGKGQAIHQVACRVLYPPVGCDHFGEIRRDLLIGVAKKIMARRKGLEPQTF
jgi:AcrR family transcriptional regulator